MHAPKLDPEILKFFEAAGSEGAKYPPVKMEVPYDNHKQTLGMIAQQFVAGGPEMAESLALSALSKRHGGLADMAPGLWGDP